MRRYVKIFLIAIAALFLCLVPQKIVLFLLPYALKRIGGVLFKRFMKTYKLVTDLAKIVQ